MSEKPREEVIAQNLALYRKLHGFTQAQLADAIGYSDKSISKWERGDGTPDIFLLLTLSEIYGITVSELVGQTEKCKSTQEKIKYKGIAVRSLMTVWKFSRASRRPCEISAW